MERITARIRNKKLFLTAAFVYSVAALLIFPFLRYYVDNPDTLSYLTIARKYFAHDYANAVNGYWSPLISWMLALIFNISREEIYFFKLLQLPIGLFALYNFDKLCFAIIHTKSIRVVFMFSAIPLVLSFGLLNLTPDLLFLAIILFYLSIVTEKEFYNHRHFGLIAGVLGVLLYFTKSFGFFFFLLHFTMLTLKNYLQTNEHAFKRHIAGNYLQAVICFAAVSSIWIYLISNKYGHFTISENPGFNLSREVAAGPGEKNTLPILSGGITALPNPTSLNAWEDPGLSTKVVPLHPFTVPGDLNIYKNVLVRNLLSIYYFDFRRQSGLVFFGLSLVFLFNRKRKKMVTDDYFFSLFMALIFVYGGYSLVLVHARYIWVCTILMLLLSGWILEEFHFRSQRLHVTVMAIVIFILAGFAVKRPFKEILFSADKDIPAVNLINAVLHPMETMKSTYAVDREFFSIKNELVSVIPGGVTIVSLINPNGERDGYTRASLIANFANAKYLGQVSSLAEIIQDGEGGYKADYLVVFSGIGDSIDEALWKQVYANEILPLRIYRRGN